MQDERYAACMREGPYTAYYNNGQNRLEGQYHHGQPGRPLERQLPERRPRVDRRLR